MDNLNDLRTIWLSAKTDGLPDAKEMALTVKKFRDHKLKKIILLVVTAAILAALLILVVFIYRSKFISTRIGEALMITAAISLLLTNLNSLNRFYKLKESSNAEFLKFLERTRVRQLFYYRWTQPVVMAMCVTGLSFYWYEFVYNSIALCIIVYGISLIYFAVMWFVVRPRVFKKEAIKLDATKTRIASLTKQFEEI